MPNLYEINWVTRMLADQGLTPVEVDVLDDRHLRITVRLPEVK